VGVTAVGVGDGATGSPWDGVIAGLAGTVEAGSNLLVVAIALGALEVAGDA